MVRKLKNTWNAYRMVQEEKSLDKKFQQQTNTDSRIEGLVKQINEKGYAVIENYYNKEKCKQFIQEILHLKNTRLEDFWVDEHQSDHRLFRVQQVSDLINEFSADPFLKQIGEAYLRYPLTNYMTMANHVQYSEHNIGSGGGWHRDSPFSKQFKSIVYLNDVSKENGPFQICERTNSYQHAIGNINIADKNDYSRFSEQTIKQTFSPKALTANSGTVIIVDTMGIHRGSPILNGERFALTNYFVGKHRTHQFEKYFSGFKNLT